MAHTSSWLWPDHTIGKRESRTLREEHNALVNTHAELLKSCKELANELQRLTSCEDPKCRIQSRQVNHGYCDRCSAILDARETIGRVSA